MAAAFSARELGVPIIVVVPSSTAQMMQDKMRALGADVRVFGAVWDEANVEAIRLSAEPGCVYIPPFDHVRYAWLLGYRANSPCRRTFGRETRRS